MTSSGRFFFQLNKFALVGIVSNFVLYGMYLLLTGLETGHKLAMTIVYVVGVLQTFVLNKRWTFRNDSNNSSVLVRYVAAYGLGYFISVGLLILFVDLLNLPHQLVMGATIVFVAGCMFALQKYWVFRS